MSGGRSAMLTTIDYGASGVQEYDRRRNLSGEVLGRGSARGTERGLRRTLQLLGLVESS